MIVPEVVESDSEVMKMAETEMKTAKLVVVEAEFVTGSAELVVQKKQTWDHRSGHYNSKVKDYAVM